ncbi:hypothetical protein NPS01_02480 [Nocardioides psychrotolerans]|uniref:DUF559 domain-containing protein n=1 Tax=Nocardioides psychrotolerans TaxID=1005945 RepID=A0A1I3BKY2_9ACTN|nr:DUF559 domain-containing protein [Nocardioides psychrotolerans]GEP36585.1 hypothetical protein NPS01_02480 [Nocardioides psychrotolerans]SFH62830.1 Protein of unknown function [Nocardioides psychrotolerans]
MDVETALRRLGGVASAREIGAATRRRDLRAALDRGAVLKLARGRYALPQARGQLRIAGEVSGVLSHLSAAQHWGWAVKDVPDRAWVTVRRSRALSPEVRVRVHAVYADLEASEVVAGVTSKRRTVLDCARRLPFDEALAVADSALRSGDVTRADLVSGAALLRGRGAPGARRVAGEASAEAANPFESVLRAIILDHGALSVRPQVAVVARGQTFHPDLVDEGRRVVIEADSWSFHSDHRTHGRDCVRDTALTVCGWIVLRFSWEQVMRSPAYVRAVLDDLVAALAAAER